MLVKGAHGVKHLGQHWFSSWLFIAPSHFLNQWWLIFIWTNKNKFQRDTNIFNQGDAFENVVCNMSTISFRPQCPKRLHVRPIVHCWQWSWTKIFNILYGDKWRLSGSTSSCYTKGCVMNKSHKIAGGLTRWRGIKFKSARQLWNNKFFTYFNHSGLCFTPRIRLI